MIDLLKMLYEKQITLEEAYDLRDDAVDRAHAGEFEDISKYLGFDVWEVSSNANVAGLENLAKLRYEGWAETCYKCRRKIIKEKGGWWFDMDENDSLLLRHISCEDKYLKQVYGEDFLKAEK